jgi:hypothetical protein
MKATRKKNVFLWPCHQEFDLNNPSQQKTCEKGEACLWYSYQVPVFEKNFFFFFIDAASK